MPHPAPAIADLALIPAALSANAGYNYNPYLPTIFKMYLSCRTALIASVDDHQHII